MTNFKTYYEQVQNIVEKLITFDGKAYPKSGHIVILAGGAGGGKGFLRNKLLGIEGKIFDVDKLKSLSIRVPVVYKQIEKEFGIKKDDIDLKNPEHVSMLHHFISKELELPDKELNSFANSVMTTTPDLKPNMIFDVTLKDISKLIFITDTVEKLGYDKTKIHIVWVMNDVKVAMDQNAKRSRYVNPDILLGTHMGASTTMEYILGMGDNLKRYMDGDIILAFNKAFVDSNLEKSILAKHDRFTDVDDKGNRKQKAGEYIKKSDYVYVKHAGKRQLTPKEVDDRVLNKIIEYVPKQSKGNWKKWLKEIK